MTLLPKEANGFLSSPHLQDSSTMTPFRTRLCGFVVCLVPIFQRRWNLSSFSHGIFFANGSSSVGPNRLGKKSTHTDVKSTECSLERCREGPDVHPLEKGRHHVATTFDSPTATNARDQASWGFWFLWVAASTAGFALGAAAFWALGEAHREDASIAVRTIVFVLMGVIVTTSPGFLHWLILRQRFPHTGWWIPASGVGSVLGFVMLLWGVAVADTRGGDRGFWPITYGWVVPILAVALGGAVAGTLQWFVLRRWVAHAGWWIPISSISWVASTSTYVSLTRANDVHLLFGAVISGALSGAITGLALVSLLRTTGKD
jgi:hypothetical protein